MKYGVREICDVVLRAKKQMTIGSMTFYEDMPVFYFDSLKTSTLESAATTVYAQGGKGNARLIAWEGERTVTFTMEDALISTLSLSILSGAGVMEQKKGETKVHATETVVIETGNVVYTTKQAYYNENNKDFNTYLIPLDENGDINGAPIRVSISPADGTGANEVNGKYQGTITKKDATSGDGLVEVGKVYLLDYYYISDTAVTRIDITPDKFAGNYYLEGATLFRNKDGKDLPAEFIIPNCKIQSNFTFTMASSGDPSTFTFTMDAFPDYTKYDPTTKVLAAIQILSDTTTNEKTIAPEAGTLTYGTPTSANYGRKKNGAIDEI